MISWLAGVLLLSGLLSAVEGSDTQQREKDLWGPPLVKEHWRGYSDSRLSAMLLTKLPPREYTATKWEGEWQDRVPEACSKVCASTRHNFAFNDTDLNVYDVKYTDSAKTWQFCVHESAPWDPYEVFKWFGRLPITMRMGVRHLIIFPPTSVGGLYHTASKDISLFGHFDIETMVHEVGHGLDYHGCAFPGKDELNATWPSCSATQTWEAVSDQDVQVPTPYARKNQVENFAETVALSLLEFTAPGAMDDLERLSPNLPWRGFEHQLNAQKTYCAREFTNAGYGEGEGIPNSQWKLKGQSQTQKREAKSTEGGADFSLEACAGKPLALVETSEETTAATSGATAVSSVLSTLLLPLTLALVNL